MTNVLFTTDEVLLNRMEAYTMLGQYDRAILDLKAYTLSKLGYEPAVPNDSYTQALPPTMHSMHPSTGSLSVSCL